MPATFTTVPVSFSGAVIQRLDAVLANIVIPGSTLRYMLSQEVAVLDQEAPTLSAAGRQQLAGLLPELGTLIDLPSINGGALVSVMSQFINFLKDKPSLKDKLDDVLARIPVQSNFLVPVLSGLDAAAQGENAGSLGNFIPQQDFILSQPFVSARFLALLAQEATGNFVDAGPVAISFSGVSDQIQTAGEVNNFLLVAPQTGQLMVQIDSPLEEATGGESFSAALSVFDGTGQLVDSSATGPAGVGVLGFDVQAGQSYYVQVAGASTGQYNLLFALAFGEPSLGTGNSSSANGATAGLLASVLAAGDSPAPATRLLPLSESSFGLVATLLTPGIGGPASADAQSSANRGPPLSGAGSEGQDEPPVSDTGGGLASLVGGLDEALAGTGLPARDGLPRGPLNPLSVDRLLAAGKQLSGDWLPKIMGDSGAPDPRLQDLARTVYQLGADAARLVGRRLPFSWPGQPAGSVIARPAAQERPLPRPTDKEGLPPQDESDPEPPPTESRRESPRTWEASLAVALALLGACRQRQCTGPGRRCSGEGPLG